MSTNILDLRGLSCPLPVFETKKAVEQPQFKAITVLVDTKTSVENIKRLLDGKEGLQYSVDESEDYIINISKTPV